MTDQNEDQALPDVFNDVQQEEPVAGALDTVQFATLYPTGGAPVHLPITDVDAPPTISDALNAAGLTVVDGAQVDPHTTRLADSMTISAVGNVKGG